VHLLSAAARDVHHWSSEDGLIHLISYINGRNGNGNGEEIHVPTPAVVPGGGLQGR
jgi:hypothetical protein